MKYALVSFLVIAFIGCKDSSTDPDRMEGFVLTTDRVSYYFTTDSVKDPLYLTFHNATDSIVYSWWPAYDQYKTDSGWTTVSISCGGFQDPILLPQQSITKPWYIFGRSTVKSYEGEHRIVAEIVTDTTKGFEVVTSNSFHVRYK